MVERKEIAFWSRFCVAYSGELPGKYGLYCVFQEYVASDDEIIVNLKKTDLKLLETSCGYRFISFSFLILNQSIEKKRHLELIAILAEVMLQALSQIAECNFFHGSQVFSIVKGEAAEFSDRCLQQCQLGPN